ncbi:integrase arm-type DNA-binding domain-containing protein [Bradyrhizobium sp. LA6.12]|uniref:tyrosine-type recombinase/integrase n=2 Tax=Bradyrhizobium TaxID=374 RepID=UPI0033971A9D
MPYITDLHLKASDTRQSISDCPVKGQKGFVLRTTPNGVFSFYYQYLNKKRLHPETGKPVREWHLIGEHPVWTIARARAEATALAGLVASGKSITAERARDLVLSRATGRTFRQMQDAYMAYCEEPVLRRWGTVPRKESHDGIRSALSRPLAWWGDRVASEITSQEIMELYRSYVTEKHPAQANNVLQQLGTMFTWGKHPDRAFVTINPVPTLRGDDRATEVGDIEDGLVLTADQLRKFWFGLDDPHCPGSPLTKLALKLSLVTLLRTGECCAIPRAGIGPDTVTIPLAVTKGRRSPKARDLVQPLNSLAREILGQVFSIGDPMREYAFPKARGGRKSSKAATANKRYMAQCSLQIMTRRRGCRDKERSQIGINQYLGLPEGLSPHDLRRTGACILEQLGYSDAEIGKVMTHKAPDKNAAPVTRRHYLVPVKIIERQIVDPRVKALDDLDAALREILGLSSTPQLVEAA